MFVRRVYYMLATGEIINSYMMQGDIAIPIIDRDYEVYPQLQPYANRRDEVGLFEWLETDPEIEDQFRRAYSYTIDVSVQPPELKFDFTPPPEPEPEVDERDEALRILGVIVDG